MAKAAVNKKYSYLTKALQLPDGTRKYIRAKTQAELDEKVMKAQILVNAGVDICSEETFGHFAQMWYDLYKKPYLRENSLNAIKYVLNQHILPYIGGYRLRDISPMQIQAIMASLSKKSNSLQSKVLIHLRSIFKAAQENGLVAKSPVSSMLKPGGKKTAEKTALVPQESRLLTERVENPRARTFLLIALHTGMRRGEILCGRTLTSTSGSSTSGTTPSSARERPPSETPSRRRPAGGTCPSPMSWRNGC